ncbi:hypothetical protein GCM10028791_24780 [Echinicola sediminis]
MASNGLAKGCFAFILLFLWFGKPLYAQGNLDKKVSLQSLEQKTVGEILENAAKEQDFFFSYNSNIIPEDSLVHIPHYEGSIRGLLSKALGGKYEFIETSGYIVIRYAPNKLYLDDSNELASGKSWVVSGRVKDLQSGELIAYASVYDRSMLVSSMTDQQGYFELKVKNPNQSVMLTISKENYRDTTFMLLPSYDLTAKRKKGNVQYYPNGEEETIQETFFGRMLIGFRQQMQGLNIGNFFAEMPVQVSLVPRLSTHGMMNSQIINHASFNILGGYTAGVNGVELGGVFNINRKNADCLQAAGVFNLVGGNSKGVQLAGVSNRVLGDTDGLQAAGIFNVSHQFQGLQLAGLYNKAYRTKGLQLAGLFNNSRKGTDNQVSGLFNIGGKVSGLQLTSLVNIADSSAYPIALLNIINSGEKSFSIGYDELQMGTFTVRTGGTYTYGLLGLAYATEDRQYNWAIDAGLGLHMVKTPYFALDTELFSRTSLGPPKTTVNLAALKLLPAIKINRHFRLFCGPSLNYLYRHNPEENTIPGWIIEDNSNSQAVQGWYIGLSGGLQFVFI